MSEAWPNQKYGYAVDTIRRWTWYDNPAQNHYQTVSYINQNMINNFI